MSVMMGDVLPIICTYKVMGKATISANRVHRDFDRFNSDRHHLTSRFITRVLTVISRYCNKH